TVPPSHIDYILYLDTTGHTMRIGMSQKRFADAQHAMIYQMNETQASQRYHSATIIPLIQEMMKKLELTWSQLSGIALNIGPGSFTGIRTGVVTVRTLAQFLNCPVYCFNQFETLMGIDYPQGACILMDALRGNAYTASLTLFPEKATPNSLQYHQEPCLMSLLDASKNTEDSFPNKSNPIKITPSTTLLASDTILQRLPELVPDFLSHMPFNIVSLEQEVEPNHNHLEHMMQLIHHFPDRFLTPWQQILPLYLQGPNITLRKAKPGKLN
ncbi:MAG: tRNA (adenosine(37)-N6)-threonylcarbamoyltransferase complex dimerization subunit type 1 TsaB, partial [Cyanobacteria bacterium]|nr:tRNA (adenosine(37)-N6)-threonylcarbamoyltransferase complex dimerization subunit type 1 TsaB [Cyanobacteriota bacterium]